MAKAKGPGPMSPIASAIKAGIRKKEEERVAAMAKPQGMPEESVDFMTKGSKMRSEKEWRPGSVDENRKMVAGPSNRQATSSRADMIKQGFFVEKDGDLFPTKKYEEYKKTGKIKGITNFQ
jgi:hypothetical protein